MSCIRHSAWTSCERPGVDRARARQHRRERAPCVIGVDTSRVSQARVEARLPPDGTRTRTGESVKLVLMGQAGLEPATYRL